MQKIQRVSFLFKILFQTAFILLPIILAFFWYRAPLPLEFFNGSISMSFIPKSILAINHSPFTLNIKILGFLISLIPTAIVEFILWFLIKLFTLYEQAEIFTLQNVKYIRNIGCTLLVGQILDPIYQVLLSATLTWQNTPGQRLATITLGGTDAGIVLVALFTILISWIMAEGCKLREEQKYTI